MMVHDQNRPQSNSNPEESCDNEAGCLYALITSRRSVSRRNRASWYLRQLNKVVKCDTIEEIERDNKQEEPGEEVSAEEPKNENDNQSSNNLNINNANPDEKDIYLVSITNPHDSIGHISKPTNGTDVEQKFLVTPKTRVLYLSKSIATSIILDLSPSVVSVSAQNDCVFLDSMYDALKRVLHLLVKGQEIPSTLDRKNYVMAPKIFVSVIAYTPFIIAKNNQVLVQNRRISHANIEQVLVEIWICLNKLTQEIHELVTNTYGLNLEYESAKTNGTAFIFPQPISGSVIRHPGSVLEDIYELGLFSASLMPRLSRLSIVIITDGLFASTNNLNVFRLKSIAVSFISLGAETVHPDACFGYTPYTDLMRFVARSTQGVHISHKDLIELSQSFSKSKDIPSMSNPLYSLFSWTLHSQVSDEQICYTPRAFNMSDGFDLINADLIMAMRPEHIAKFFCLDQPMDSFQSMVGHLSQNSVQQNHTTMNINNYHDWRSFKQLDRHLDADFEQVLSSLLREGYLIKDIQFKQRETCRIVARLILHWKHNLDLEQELTAPYWNNTDPFDLSDNNSLMLRPFNAPIYGDTYCEIIVHGSYSFLHNLYCDKKVKRKSDYREIAYRQFRQLIDGVLQTHERLQYLSRFYRDSSLSKIPSYLLHGNSLLYEQPHTHKLTSTIENVGDEAKTNDFQEYWQKISCLDTRSWKNLMHIHTLRLVLEHDQPKHKNIHCQNANGRYTHIQCRRALSAISNFIKSYASFALLEDTTYIKFIYNKDDDLREIETSATKGFIVIRINKLLPIVVIYLMFTSGILDSNRVQIVNYLEDQLVNCKLRNGRPSIVTQTDNILKSKTIYPSSESCCVLIKSPLERMLKVYSRNFIGDFLTQNLTLGLPGSYPFMQHYQQQQQHQSFKTKQSATATDQQHQQTHPTKSSSSTTTNRVGGSGPTKDMQDDFTSVNSINRYNLVFGKYLYGVRVVHTIANLPHDLVHSLASNVLAKISAILVNARIKQGFHIAFNNSGILNLVVELAMKDHSHEFHTSSCLCQYIVFPPAVTGCSQAVQAVLNSTTNNGTTTTTTTTTSNNNNNNGSSTLVNGNGSASSKLAGGVGSIAAAAGGGSLSGSLANSDQSYMNVTPQELQSGGHDGPMMRNNSGEIKVIREYWIEQQYGVSCQSDGYHRSLQDMRYSEIVDHLFLTDSKILECLLTYDLLQLLCDKLSPHYDLDGPLSQPDSARMEPIFSPTTISSSNSSTNLMDAGTPSPSLPSSLIEGNTRDGTSKIPLLEFAYEFSLLKFLDYCQQASLNVLLFKDKSDYFHSNVAVPSHSDTNHDDHHHHNNHHNHHQHQPAARSDGPTTSMKQTTRLSRKMSVDVTNNSYTDREYHQQQHHHQQQHSRREHRSSYDNLNSGASNYYVAQIYSQSLNHLFLETLHKRLKQMHDKELKLSESDMKKLASYLNRRKSSLDIGDTHHQDQVAAKCQNRAATAAAASRRIDKSFGLDDEDDEERGGPDKCREEAEAMEWRCFLRKGNQENMMIVFIPARMDDISRWMSYVDGSGDNKKAATNVGRDVVCPIFVFRCSSTIINDQILSFLDADSELDKPSTLNNTRSSLEQDLSLHFGQPCRYMDQLKVFNDELNSEILPLAKFGALNQTISDEKTLEIVHFRAFLRKIKNTVLKSRFSSLNDAYLSELFVHKNDILYYLNNVDQDTQKKYHVSAQLKNLAEFIRTYEDYTDSLPKEPMKACNELLNSILLQKCGLFINQPIARFNESNPLIKQLNDRKLLYLMRCNYKLELPILEENLSGSTLLKEFVKAPSSSSCSSTPIPAAAASTAGTTPTMSYMHQHYSASLNYGPQLSSSINESKYISSLAGVCTPPASSSLGRSAGASRLFDMRCNSMGGGGGGGGGASGSSQVGSPSAHFASTAGSSSAPRFSTSTTVNSLPASPANDTFILEAFRNSPCPINDISPIYLKPPATCSSNYEDGVDEIGLRHEAHMAEVLKRKCERKESHHYRRVLKSKTNYNQSHSAIDQALKRVDSLGRLEHFCLTPLLFSPAWRSKLAPVRDHTLAPELAASNKRTGGRQSAPSCDGDENEDDLVDDYDDQELDAAGSRGRSKRASSQEEEAAEADERWHQTVCTNYIKEYEQYIQTLGFNSVQIRYQSSAAAAAAAASTAAGALLGGGGPLQRKSSKNLEQQQPSTASTTANQQAATTTTTTTTTTYNTGYLIKFLNSGCFVFKVGFCRPYVYSILYSIEGERFNNSNLRMNMTAFLDELDHIKLTMHLHSFTYDYHLRSIYSYISGRQTTFSPGYHLISFVDDFRKYYQKAPNYARNHILSGEVRVDNINISGQQLYNYIVTHNSVYSLDILEMSSAGSLASLLYSLANQNQNNNQQQQLEDLANHLEHDQEQHQVNHVGQDVVAQEINNSSRSHANDYVLIELKREKVRYRDGKDPDVFECGLLITHDIQRQQQSEANNSLTLKYFLLLTNQRDLYPKLIHTDDTIISLGCHRPIRLGVNAPAARQQLPALAANKQQVTPGDKQDVTTTTATPPPPPPPSATTTASSVDEHEIQSNELMSSDEHSGRHSVVSTISATDRARKLDSITGSDTDPQVAGLDAPPEEAADALVETERQLARASTSTEPAIGGGGGGRPSTSSPPPSQSPPPPPPLPEKEARKRHLSTTASDGPQSSQPGGRARAICDEQITYLGYFSSDEMDMLKFLQEKTKNLRSHIDRIVRQAEVHYRRDYLWQKLMQRAPDHSGGSANKSTGGGAGGRPGNNNYNDYQMPLTMDELVSLLQIVESIDLASLDHQLSMFTTLHINWYLKLLKAFNDLKQSTSGGAVGGAGGGGIAGSSGGTTSSSSNLNQGPGNTISTPTNHHHHHHHHHHHNHHHSINSGGYQPSLHRIFTVKLMSKNLVLYIDPKCMTAFILLSIDSERGSIELNMMLKDRHQCGQIVRLDSTGGGSAGKSPPDASHEPFAATSIELDQDCQQLINDFINFCATFMWSTLLT